MIVILLDEEPRRFGELHRQVEGITKKVLIDSLRALERDGMVERVEQEHARYQLTALGRTLNEPLQALRVWAESYVDDVQAAQDRYDDAADDRTLRRISND
ncbi:transcriptional regulator [Kribbella antibiotica]|uniref:Transcriptional regulator n=2 Tax=Kribbella antibiotica TaxID=190195 RepID=A0A4R4YJV3_9ACTN|nr:transcriptional regulator [Kribbella antibiotica]